VIQLDVADLGILYEVSKNYDWSHIAPAIFGTLFERSLDPARRSLIGAHYTSEEDILLLIEPVLVRPLRQRWESVKQRILEALEIERAEEAARNSRQARLRVDLPSEKLLGEWIEELTAVRVLDPACGSGNFLYLALRRMLDLWLEATQLCRRAGHLDGGLEDGLAQATLRHRDRVLCARTGLSGGVDRLPTMEARARCP
jgi:hypothetical protein